MIPDQINDTDNQMPAANRTAVNQTGSAPIQHKQTRRPSMDHRPELLAPAGDFESLRAAIRNGADAVYLGAGSFNARQKAANFGGGLLQEAIDEAHRHALRVYLTLNTLVTDDELPFAARIAEEAYIAGIDGIILQDVGLIRTIHRNLPDLPLFASTQMTIGDAAGLRAAARLGLKRVILARELSLAEITHLCGLAKELNLEIEVFVHGALCISISGQCLMSSLNGGRSGNRGACAQPCRLPWRLGKVTGPINQDGAQPGSPANGSSPTGGSSSTSGSTSATEPWLSPRDQGLFAHLDELRQAGVTSLKIEGRMRNSTYVGQVVSVYRELLDQLDQLDSLDQSGQTSQPLSLTAARRRLLLAFNRGGGFNDRYLTGHMEREFLSGVTSGSHGVLLGTISRLNPRSGEMTIQLDAQWPVDALPGRGDVLSIRRPQAAEETASAPIGSIRSEIGANRSEIGASRKEIGANRGEISRIRGENVQLVVRGFHPDVLEKLMERDPVYCMTDHAAELQTEKADRGRTAITFQIKRMDPATVRLTATVLNGPKTGLQHHLERPLESINAIATDRLDQQLRKTGQTVFRVVATDLSNEITLSIGSLNDLRRQLLEQLTDKIVTACHRTLPAIPAASPDAADPALPTPSTDAANSIHPSLSPIISAYYYRLPTDLATIACGADEYVLPLIGLTATLAADLVQALRQAEPNCRILAWLPPFNSGRLIDTLPELIQALPGWGFDGILAIQAGPDIGPFPESFAWQIDSGANITNSESLHHWLELGADAAALSHELNGEQANNLLRSLIKKQSTESARSRQTEVMLDPASSGKSFASASSNNPLLTESTRHHTIVRPLYGHLRVMTNVYCPVGHNLPGCRRCHTTTPDELHPDPGSLYQLEDRRQLIFPLLTHPRDCHIEIMQHSILCVPQPLLDLQQFLTLSSDASEAQSALPTDRPDQHPATRLAARLFFLDETVQDRQQLIRQARDLLTTANQSQSSQIHAIVAFTDTAAEIARRTSSKLHQDLPISLMPTSLA